MYNGLSGALAAIEREGGNTIEGYKNSVTVCAQALEQLSAYVHTQGFASTGDEIVFFKELKPEVGCLYLYYRRLFQIEVSRTNASRAYDEALLLREAEGIRSFFEGNAFLIRYYRSGATYLDDKLFVRATTDANLPDIDLARDNHFTGVCDQFIATLKAYEKLGVYIRAALEPPSERVHPAREKTLQWTDSKAALIELLYALQRKGSINNGQADLKDIAALFETVFGIELGNYYRTFQEIRIRKNGRTNYLEQLKKVLLQYMDETDLNYKE